MVCDIGKSIKKKDLENKRIVYMIILFHIQYFLFSLDFA